MTLKVLTDFISVVGLSALMWPKWARQYFIITTGATLLGDYSHTPVSQGKLNSLLDKYAFSYRNNYQSGDDQNL